VEVRIQPRRHRLLLQPRDGRDFPGPHLLDPPIVSTRSAATPTTAEPLGVRVPQGRGARAFLDLEEVSLRVGARSSPGLSITQRNTSSQLRPSAPRATSGLVV